MINETAIGQGPEAQIDVEQGVLDDLSSWLIGEITRAESDRADFEQQITDWDRQYEAIPTISRKTFPWDGAANLIVPITSISVDAEYARIMNAIFASKQMWLPTAKSPAWAEVIEPLTVWLNWVGKSVLKMRKYVGDWILGTLKYGTGVMKLVWERRFRKVIYKDASGALVNEPVLLYDNPVWENIRIEDFLVSPDAYSSKDIQKCTWVAQRFTITKKDLKEREYSGVFQNVDNILNETRSTPTVHEEESQTMEKITVSQYTDYQLYEVWCSYDIDGDGVPEELVVDIHIPTRTILRAVYNFYKHQERPFHVIWNMPREGRFLGIGICQMLEDIQNELSTIHNQRLDNATIANTRMWKRKKGAIIGIDEIYPGCFIDVDEMDDITGEQLGDIYPSLLREEMHTEVYGERRTGISDYTVGRESSAIGSRATATSTLALIKEGNKRFMMFENGIRDTLVDIAHQLIALYQQFSDPNNLMYEMFSETEKQYIQKYFSLPDEYSRQHVLVEVPATSETTNKDLEKQALLTLMGVMQQFYTTIMQAFSVAANPQAPEPVKNLAIQGAQAGSKLMERILEAFDFRDPETFVPDIEQLLGIQNQMVAQMNNLQGVINGQTGMGVPTQDMQGGRSQPAMENTPSSTSTTPPS